MMNKTIGYSFIAMCMITALGSGCHKSSCAPGYEGSSCTAVNVKYAGTYAGVQIVTADGNSNPAEPDTVIITAGNGPDSLLINNTSSPIIGVVGTSSSSYTVASQTVMYNGVPVVMGGTGMLHGDTLSGTFAGNIGGLPFTLAFQGVRR